MKTSHRGYSDMSGDFPRLCRFIVCINAQVRTCSTWGLGRLMDATYEKPGFCDLNAHLWFDDLGDMVGLAISENGGGGFAILTADAYRFLFEEMLGWVMAEWGDRKPHLSIEITEHQAVEACVLERQGFKRQSTFYSRRFDLTRQLPDQRPLEKGFSIVDMASHPDFPALYRLRRNGFEGVRSVTQEELEREKLLYERSSRPPTYHASCDLCVMAEDGTYVSACEGQIDAQNASGDIERIVTHSDFRRRGFARAVIWECMRRLQGMGVRNLYIIGYSAAAIALYGSLGHVEELACSVYAKK